MSGTAETGTMRLIKSLIGATGIDADKLEANVTGFMENVRGAVEKLEANQRIIETKLDRIQATIDRPPAMMFPPLFEGSATPAALDGSSGDTVEIRKPNGEATGVLLTTEKFPQAVLDELSTSASR